MTNQEKILALRPVVRDAIDQLIDFCNTVAEEDITIGELEAGFDLAIKNGRETMGTVLAMASIALDA